MSSVQLSPTPIMRFYDNNNNPLVGGQLFTYQAGTTTPAPTYTDSTALTLNPNPVIMNARGEAPVWMLPTQAYKLVLEDAAGNTIWTVDNITAPAPVAVGNMTDEKGSGGTPGFAANVDFTPGTTTSLTLSQNYGSAANLWVAFDAAEQGADSFSLNGLTLTFTSAIPVGVSKVYVKGGTALTIGVPNTGTVTDATVAANANIQSSKLSFLQQGVGAIARTVQNKLYEFISVKDFGAKGDGTTDDTTAIQTAENAVAAAGGGFLLFPEGIYIINNTGISKASNVDWLGAAYGSSVLKAAVSVFSTGGIVNGSSLSGFVIEGITFDFTAASGNLGLLNLSLTNDYTVERCQFLGNFKFAISHNGGNRAIFRNNKFLRTTASSSQNQGLLMSTSAGNCQNCLVEGNYHLNTGMDLSCQYTTIRDNQTYNWQFGAGITIEQNNQCSDLKIINNTNIGGTGTDVNSTVCLGIENWAPRSQIIGNTCSSNAGDGISNGGQNCQIVGNTCSNNGQVSGNGITSRYTSSSVNGNYSTICSNNCIDTQGSPTQSYGYADFSGSVFGVFLSGNTFSGNKLGGENIIGATAVAAPVFNGKVSFNPGTLTNGSSAGGGFAITGAALGDMCVVGYDGSDLQGVKLFAWVSGANAVSFRFENNTGSSIGLGSGNVYVGVIKRLNFTQF